MGNLLLEGYNIEITGEPVEITSYNGYDIDIYSGRDLYLDARYDIYFNGDVSFYGDVDFSDANVFGLDLEEIDSRVIRSWTNATKCYISASAYGITVRDRYGDVLGDIYYD